MLGRCNPVATRIKVFSAEMPASRSTWSIGRRIVWLGTGRVMSQIKMQASLRPFASARRDRRADRLFERRGDGALGIVERRNVLDRERADHAIRREIHGQSRAAVIERKLAVISFC